jgi:hypothetical protein
VIYLDNMIENFEHEIVFLLNQRPRPTIEQILQLISNYGKLRGLSSRSVRRIIKEKNVLNRCLSEELREAVESSISEVIKRKTNKSSNFLNLKGWSLLR